MVARAVALLAVVLVAGLRPALATDLLEPITIKPGQERIELTLVGVLYENQGDMLQVNTAASLDGIVGRMAVPSVTAGSNPKWVVFALENPGKTRIERWVVAERYDIVGSGFLDPILDQSHIADIKPSVGFKPERIANERADIFRLELDAGATVTFVAELSSRKFPRVYLWTPEAYQKKQRDRVLFNGILLGITGIMGIFLTAIFAANHKFMFPAAAMVAWSVLAYLAVDAGFWHKLFQLDGAANGTYRAAAESAVVAALLVFLYTFLRLPFWHGWIKVLFSAWALAQLAIVGLALAEPGLATTLARGSMLVISAVGTLLILYLIVRGQDRALAVVPTWLLFLVWVFAATVGAIGLISGDIVASSLQSGLVLVVLLFGFTVTQFAFRGGEPVYGAAPSQLHLSALALDASGAAIWEWNARRDEISVGPEVEHALGLSDGELSCRTRDWLQHLHPADRDRLSLILRSVQEQIGGEVLLEFRMRRSDSTYLWYELRAQALPMAQHRSLRCLGLMRDITHQKRSRERLMHDAVHDSLTSLPNRALFLDRMQSALIRHKAQSGAAPTVLFVDIDRFRNVNQGFGLLVGDSMLLTVARRLARHLSPLDSLARIGGDQFGILVAAEASEQEIAMLAERVRRSLRSPMKISGQEIILTASIGIARFDGSQASHLDLLHEAEIAMYRAKRGGADRIEVFKPAMRNEKDDRLALESDLRRAIERKQLRVFFQPIMRLDDQELMGFEALLRWEHPRLGRLSPNAFIGIAEEADIIGQIGTFVLNTAAQAAVRWQKALPRPNNPLSVSVNISSRQLFRDDLVQDVRLLIGRQAIPAASLRLEVTETLVMENPEHAAEILQSLRATGIGLAIDDFGTGYSSLSYLHRFPFDVIKIDKALVRQRDGDEQAAAIVRSVIALARELKCEVVAEGVERAEDVTFLRKIGCHYAQGFLLGEPMPEREALALVAAIAKGKKSQGQAAASTAAATVSRTVGKAAAKATETTDTAKAADGSAAGGQAGAATASTGQAAREPVNSAAADAERGSGEDGADILELTAQQQTGPNRLPGRARMPGVPPQRAGAGRGVGLVPPPSAPNRGGPARGDRPERSDEAVMAPAQPPLHAQGFAPYPPDQPHLYSAAADADYRMQEPDPNRPLHPDQAAAPFYHEHAPHPMHPQQMPQQQRPDLHQPGPQQSAAIASEALRVVPNLLEVMQSVQAGPFPPGYPAAPTMLDAAAATGPALRHEHEPYHPGQLAAGNGQAGAGNGVYGGDGYTQAPPQPALPDQSAMLPVAPAILPPLPEWMQPVGPPPPSLVDDSNDTPEDALDLAEALKRAVGGVPDFDDGAMPSSRRRDG